MTHMSRRGASLTLAERDVAVVNLVVRFRQMTTSQIRNCLFRDLASSTPLMRTLKRLVERQYLNRLSRPVGGDQGGSAQHVFQLGRQGWKLIGRPGNYWAPKAVNLHTLAISECYASLRAAEHGNFEIIKFETEPECHRSIGDVSLTPDAYLEIGRRSEGMKEIFMLEIDRSTEHADKLRDKCVRYWRAFQRWTDEFYPMVVIVVPDQPRAAYVRQVIRGGPDEAQALFQVCAYTELVPLLARGGS